MQRIRKNYQHTVYACYIGYISQATVNNYIPLLFVTFQNTYHISLELIGLLIFVNFGTQLLVDVLSAKFVDKIGYRKSIVCGHICCTLGLLLLGVLPELFPAPFVGLCIPVILYAIGGGLIEVLISPILEGCPSNNKAAAMSLLHSFYCWGSVLVILGSTILFSVFGLDSWKAISCFWAVIPLFNSLYFSIVPIRTTTENTQIDSAAALFRSKLFWSLVVMMVCAGASELAMAQWASAFAESGLRISKTMGDLAGPCFFAVLMGISRVVHAAVGSRFSLRFYMSASAVLCIAGYLTAVFSPVPLISLLGCGICGFAVGAMWPGTFSLASEKCPAGGTVMFALLALGGDCGCGGGPAIVGIVSEQFGGNLKLGLLSAVAFPLLMLITVNSPVLKERS